MKKRGAIELSLNFLVMLIITIVIFSFGIKMGYDLMNKSNKMVDQVSRENAEQLKSTPNADAKVAIPEGMVKLKPDQKYILGIGIYNILEGKRAYGFSVEPYKYLANANSEENFVIEKRWFAEEMVVGKSKDLDPNAKEVLSLPIQVPAGTKKGTYIFEVVVCVGDAGAAPSCEVANRDNHFGDVHLFMVNVI